MDLLATLISLIKSFVLIIHKKAEEHHASRVKLTEEYKQSSDRFCLCLAKGSERIKSILAFLISDKATKGEGSEYAILKDCSELLSEFNAAKLDFLKAIHPLYLECHDPQEYNDCKDKLEEILDNYAHDIQDIYYICKLAYSIEPSLSENNSELLKNIISLFSDANLRVNDIVSLRFRENGIRDYYTDIQGVCNDIARIVSLPVHSDSSIIVSPLRAGLGKAEQQYKLGRLFLKQGKKKDAIMWFEKAIEKGNPEANLELGRLLLKEGKTDAGLMLLKNAADAGHQESVLELGKYYLNHSEAYTAIDYLSRLSNHHRGAKYYLAQAYELMNETSKSTELFAELVGEKGTEKDLYSVAAMSRIMESCTEGRFLERNGFDAVLPIPVLELFENEMIVDSNYEDDVLVKKLRIMINLQKAYLFYRFGKYDRANNINLKYLKMNSAIAEFNLGKHYYDVDEDEIAEKYFRLSASQNYPKAYAYLGYMLVQKNDLEYGYNYIKTAAGYRVRNAYFFMLDFYNSGLAAKIGKGTREDGAEYERRYHQTANSLYYYVSIVDHSLNKSSLIDGCLDLCRYSNNPLYWWANLDPYGEDLFDLSQAAEATEIGNNVIDRNYLTIPYKGKILTWPQENKTVSLTITVLLGCVRFFIYDKQTNQLLHTIEISHDDEINSIYIYYDEQEFSFISIDNVSVITRNLEWSNLNKEKQ